MRGQGDLFLQGATAETSRAAYDSIEPEMNRLEALVLSAIRSAGDQGRTCDELEVITGLSHQCCSARVNGLAKRCAITLAGDKRKTRSNRLAFVWRSR